MRLASPLIFALLLACPPLASAQPAPPSHMTDEALAHSEAATRFFTLRRYDDAAQEFQTAYALSGVPELLFNLGRAFEEANHLADALDAYTRFRAALPADADHAALDARIEAVRQRRAAQASAPPAVVTPPPTVPRAPPTVRTPPVETPHPPPPPAPRSRVLPIALMAGGGVALLGAAALGVSVIASNASLSDECPDQQCPTPHRDDISSGRARALATDVIGAVGIAALAAGVIVWVVQGPTAARRVAFDASGASLTVRF